MHIFYAALTWGWIGSKNGNKIEFGLYLPSWHSISSFFGCRHHEGVSACVCEYSYLNHAILRFPLFCCGCHPDVFHYILPPAYALVLTCLLSSDISSLPSSLVLCNMSICYKILYLWDKVVISAWGTILFYMQHSDVFSELIRYYNKRPFLFPRSFVLFLSLESSSRDLQRLRQKPVLSTDNILYIKVSLLTLTHSQICISKL